MVKTRLAMAMAPVIWQAIDAKIPTGYLITR